VQIEFQEEWKGIAAVSDMQIAYLMTNNEEMLLEELSACSHKQSDPLCLQ